jgi:diguanylate cyclase (GGDEF)-like protein
MVGETLKLSLANLKLRKTLQERATRDPLTGLFNRRYLEETLPRELHGALRREARLCVAMIDLDNFKRFNDTFGHDTGDLVLRESGRLLHENLRKSDIACRYGGEE